MREPHKGRDPAKSILTTGWQSLPTWRILDTDFGNGRTFFKIWQAWLADLDRPQVLHYVALCQMPVASDVFFDSAQETPETASLASELAGLWFGLLPGFHRFLLAQGQVVLTLCVGETLAQLRQQQFQADAIALTFNTNAPQTHDTAADLWLVKALVRCSRRGTTVFVTAVGANRLNTLKSHLTQCGFQLTDDATPATACESSPFEARFDPAWPLKTSRQTQLPTALPVQRCAVIGAGLAGASVAASLARRGWQVRVLDQAETPAAGASGLPVGLVVPHVSSDDCTLSRLSRAGVRMMLQQASEHLKPGQWAASGVFEREIAGTPHLPRSWPAAGHDWSTDGTQAPSSPGALPLGPGLWHPRAAWLKPAELVSAWLKQASVTFQGHAKVAHLRRDAGVWELLDGADNVLCRAERVVFANACGAQTLLDTLRAKHPDLDQQLAHLPVAQGMRGLLSWAEHTRTENADTPPHPPFPAFPVNGSGSVVPLIPIEAGHAWFMGSSYQPAQQPERSDQDNQQRNFEHLQQLLPTLADALAPAFTSTTLGSWKNTRCISADRLPLVGPLEDGDNPGLWMCAALGSRGLSFSVLCAELLAARFGAEPLPVEASLAKSLNALRS